MKLLLTGDLHLGRTSSRLPASKREQGRALSGWKRIVDAAIQEQVNAVILSGDILDEENKYWEASGPFALGVERLWTAGIRTLAVAGNHDAEVLPDLASSLPSDRFSLLGANGTWERITLQENGVDVVHIDGWSFPSPTYHQDPTLDYPIHSTDTLPVLGVVHGDPGVKSSPYAPLSHAHLQSLPVTGWLLGHIHKPTLTPGDPWILMPGSPHPLDPGEPDAHHAWIITVENGTLSSPVPCCPAALIYRTLELPLTAEEPLSLDAIEARLRSAISEAETDAFQVLRLHITGERDDPDRLADLTRQLTDWELPSACIEKVTLDTSLPLDLEALQQAGPVPERITQALQDLPPELQTKLQDIQKALSHRKEFTSHGLPEFSLDDLPLTSLLERTLRTALESAE